MLDNDDLLYLVLLSPIVSIMLLATCYIIKDICLNYIARGEKYSLIFALNRLREAPKILLRLALTIPLFMPLIYLWYLSDLPGLTIDLGHFIASNRSAGGNLTDISVNDGLRMVVFGGGDIATPNLLASDWDGQGQGWTEVMCQKLGCDTYLSFVPKTDGIGGAVVSNSLLDAAYRHVSAPLPLAGSNRRENAIEFGYSWFEEQYPAPDQPDLAAQIDSFLSSSGTQGAATETLWVFNIGYWDVWYLAALPRKLATLVIDSSVRDLFFQIERLYQAAQDQELVAFSDYYSVSGTHSPLELEHKTDRSARAPFRIYLTRLFDISLTPGFATARPKPPYPHSSASQLRNAAFLTNYWNALLEARVDDWLATPDPADWSTTDKIDPEVIKALVGQQPLPIDAPSQKHHHSRDNIKHDGKSSIPYREFASFGISPYLRELMIDHQLRSADLVDHKGLGARPPEDGFLDITMPCAFTKSGEEVIKYGEATDVEDRTVVCEEPDNYLFYTGFTVGQRAIREIGVRAARRLLDQVEDSSKWRERARVHKSSGRHGKGRKTKKKKAQR